MSSSIQTLYILADLYTLTHLFYFFHVKDHGLFLVCGRDHEFWSNILVKVCLADDLQLERTLLKGDALLVGILRRLGCSIITYKEVSHFELYVKGHCTTYQ